MGSEKWLIYRNVEYLLSSQKHSRWLIKPEMTDLTRVTVASMGTPLTDIGRGQSNSMAPDTTP